jgi:hypothetical protein
MFFTFYFYNHSFFTVLLINFLILLGHLLGHLTGHLLGHLLGHLCRIANNHPVTCLI